MPGALSLSRYDLEGALKKHADFAAYFLDLAEFMQEQLEKEARMRRYFCMHCGRVVVILAKKGGDDGVYYKFVLGIGECAVGSFK